MINVATAKKKTVTSCRWNVDAPLQRFPVQQQTVIVIPFSLAFLQPLMPPRQDIVSDVTARMIFIPPCVFVLIF